MDSMGVVQRQCRSAVARVRARARLGVRPAAPLLLLLLVFAVGGCSDDKSTTPTSDAAWSVALEPEYTNRAVWGMTAGRFFVCTENGMVRRYWD
ncbi:MAG TPA: hypothetical protein PLQ13_09335, partial [Candidatus Krumholzibacteria bacterium]|nr:hypothetical protein [Candidatus Krumholzibacteria bacterium]